MLQSSKSSLRTQHRNWFAEEQQGDTPQKTERRQMKDPVYVNVRVAQGATGINRCNLKDA